ncbi:hypothetical protein Lbir_1337 [Legionella birminghamensis]|uniref:Phospholipid/glycerol acyltransferase domain-containing protein n=1 Tax=Legionella birminghamensis TaxID=28083 RepID=A0A378IL35_9GAMM|nr:1-acyl-sn-glycerol-3-phosphate acyltransferase [Legionella birminghamensis]KTC72562.1 hypothetical protein Lbir_1337 [Legionella birminghamensis]STX32834.1 Uncharacterised protein [Legionella birminghamensis]
MSGFDSHADSGNESDYISSAFTLMYLVTAISVLTYTIARLAESNNHLNYESRPARVIAGFLAFMMHLLHTKGGDIEIRNTEGTLYALGPHRTGWEAGVFASKFKDGAAPPQFLATTNFNRIPGVKTFLEMFKAIPVAAHAPKGRDGQTANRGAIESANDAIRKKGCVAMFPQGNFSKIGEEPHRVYAGVARVAVENNIPVEVIRLDGFWSLQNPLIPLFIRNHNLYRVFFSALHLNNVRVTRCDPIKWHLETENTSRSTEEKIEEICAQLYAYFRETGELTPKQIKVIDKEIESGAHRLIWKNKVRRDELIKESLSLKKEAEELEKPTADLMKACAS